MKVDLTQINFNIDDLDMINSDIWRPFESDKQFMSLNMYDQAIDDYNKKKSELYFLNVKVSYDSCDCTYGACNCGNWADEIIIKTKDENYCINIDDDSLIYHDQKRDIEFIINNLKNLTYSDFIRFCELCKITLKLNPNYEFIT